MATFYFNGAADLAAELPTDWQNLGNWWMDDGFTIPATNLPSSGDDVIVSVSLDTNSGSSPITINNLTVNAPPNVSSWFIRSTWYYAGSSPPITINGVGIFNGPADADYESYVCVDITGNCTFNNRWFFGNFDGRTLTGNATFNNNAQLASYANGNCTFNNNSSCGWIPAIINGNVTLNDNSFLILQAINGDVVFNNFSYFNFYGFYGTINGDCTFNDSSYNNYGTINGLCNFNNSSYNNGTIYGDCTFNDGSLNYGGAINGNCNFNDSSSSNGAINGNCNFNDNSHNIGWITGDCNFNDSSDNGYIVNGDASFNNNATNYSQYSNGPSAGTVNGNATFSGNGKNYGVDDSGNWYVGTVNGNCTFSLSSAALHIDAALAQIKGSDSVTGTIDFEYEKGINGSSILGIV